jgi:3'-phosphoadenosine 5'-phosphosulfate sulfotransferase
MLTAAQIVELVDKIGLLKAQLAPMEELLKSDISKLKVMGPERYQGTLYEVLVFDSERATLDMEAVRAKLSPQFIAAHTTVTQVRTAKVQARKDAA